MGVCFVLSSINLNYELGIMYQKKTYYIALIGGISLIATLVLNTALVPVMAVWGALLSLLGVNLIRLFSTLYANRLCGAALIRLDLKRALAMILLVLGAALLGHFFSQNLSLLLALLSKSMLWVAVMVVLFLSPIMDPSIMKACRKTVKSLIQAKRPGQF